MTLGDDGDCWLPLLLLAPSMMPPPLLLLLLICDTATDGDGCVFCWAADAEKDVESAAAFPGDTSPPADALKVVVVTSR